MTFERKLASLFNLSDENWLRHANPISVWTRYSVLPFIILSFWTRLWIGWWCIVPVIVSLIWMVVNPIVFSKAKSTRNWASRGVLGERVYLNRDKVKLPQHHDIVLYQLLNTISFIGLILAIWSTIYYSVFTAITGIGLVYMAKTWFLDRMVWLYHDMKHDNDEYKSWDY